MVDLPQRAANSPVIGPHPAVWLQERAPAVALLLAFLACILLRICILGVGSPFITIDDKTAFEGGFLVWFGNAPPQRMYLESWIYGITCLVVYVGKHIAGTAPGGLGVDLVADAYRDFVAHPDLYVLVYRSLTLAVDLVTAWLVYRIARQALGDRWRGWAAACVAAMFLFSYNTFWSGVVARPDSFLAFFCTLGVLLYLRSGSGADWRWLLGSAAAFGAGGGLKLHGVLMVALVCVDMLRVHGMAAAIRKALPFALVAVLFFCVAAGSPLFDPLLYVKLRVANYKDDASPWIHWTNHFVTVLRGGGWLALPLGLCGAILTLTDRKSKQPDLAPLAVIAIGWCLLFLVTRPLRAYWMLPALPALYVLAIYAVGRLPVARAGLALAAAALVALVAQTLDQIRDLRSTPYDEMRAWVRQNATTEPFYIVGFDALLLPKSARCMDRTRQVLTASIEGDRAAGMPFTLRHAKNWEERSTLTLFDMLGRSGNSGYEFYDYFTTPPEALARVLDLREIRFFLVEDGSDLDSVKRLVPGFDAQYEMVARRIGAGGGAHGMAYSVYGRK